MVLYHFNNKYRTKKIWNELVPILVNGNRKTIPFNYCNRMSIIDNEGNKIPFYSKRDFNKKMKKLSLETDFDMHDIELEINFHRLLLNVEKCFDKMCKRINNSNKPSQQNQHFRSPD